MHSGGSEYYVHWLASEAAERGWDVTVLTDVHQGDQGEIVVTSDYSLLWSVRYDLIIVHGADCSSQDAVYHWLAAGAVASPVLYLLIKPSASKASYAGMQHSRYLGWSTSLDLECIHSLGQGAKAVHVTHGVQPSALGRPGAWRDRLGMAPRGKADAPAGRLFVSAGGFGPHKRVRELAAAFAEARREGDHLILFGYQAPHEDVQGYFAACEAVPGVTVRFGGERQEVLDALCEADLYVMNSEWEGFGLVLLEAMLNGTEWAATAGAGAADDLAEFGTTYKSHEELISVLRNFRRNEAHAEAIRAECMSKFTIRTSVDQIEAVVDNERLTADTRRWRQVVPVPMRLHSSMPLDDQLLKMRGMSPSVGDGIKSCSSNSSIDTIVMSSKHAFVTLLSGRSDYVQGVLGLQQSLRLVGSKLPLIVAVTPEVNLEDRKRLNAAECEVRLVQPIVAPSAKDLARPEFHLCYSKLQLWSWTEYDTLIYLDADAFPTRNVDALAQGLGPSEELAWVTDLGTAGAARHPTESADGSTVKYGNAGVMVFKPSKQTYHALLRAMYKEGVTTYRYAEQDLLNAVLGNKARELPLHFNCLNEYLREPWCGGALADHALAASAILQAEASADSVLCAMAACTTDSDSETDSPRSTLPPREIKSLWSLAGDVMPQDQTLPHVVHFTQPKPWRISAGADELTGLNGIERAAIHMWHAVRRSRD